MEGYRIVTELGTGPTGEVYFAEHESDGTRAALKVLRPAACTDPSLLTEVLAVTRVVGRLDDPRLARVFVTGPMGDLAFVATEVIEGESLEERLGRDDPLEPREAAEIAAAVADALAAAHHAGGYLHCAVKPTNVFVHQGRVKVTDFALSRLVVDLEPTVEMLRYAAPEQCRGEPADARSDVYSIGAVLYHALTGRPPFEQDDPTLLGVAHASEPLEPPRSVRPEVPRWLDAIVCRAMSKHPEERYQTAGEMADVLREGLAAAWSEEREGTQLEAELPPPTVAAEGIQAAPDPDRTEEVPLPELDGPPTQKTETPIPPAGRAALRDDEAATHEEAARRVAEKLSRALVQRIVNATLDLPEPTHGIEAFIRIAEGTDAEVELDASELIESDEELRRFLGGRWEPAIRTARLAHDLARSSGAVDSRLAYLSGVVLEGGRALVEASIPGLAGRLSPPDRSHVGEAVVAAVVGACQREVAVSLAYAWHAPEAVAQALPKVGDLDQDPNSLANFVTVALAVGMSSGGLAADHWGLDAEATIARGLPLIGLTPAACDAIVALQEDLSDEDDPTPAGLGSALPAGGETPETTRKAD